jgi:hypothetical protein
LSASVRKGRSLRSHLTLIFNFKLAFVFPAKNPLRFWERKRKLKLAIK